MVMILKALCWLLAISLTVFAIIVADWEIGIGVVLLWSLIITDTLRSLQEAKKNPKPPTHKNKG